MTDNEQSKEPSFSDHLAGIETHIAGVDAPEASAGETKTWQTLVQFAVSVLRAAAARGEKHAAAPAAPAPGGYGEVTVDDLHDVSGVSKPAAARILEEIGPLYMPEPAEGEE